MEDFSLRKAGIVNKADGLNLVQVRFFEFLLPGMEPSYINLTEFIVFDSDHTALPI